ncbi:MAG: TonB family protein [Sphingobacteriaceae bacterium]
MNTFEYFLQVNSYLLLFYVFYFILLRQETFFNMNRAYLLGSVFLSFLIPVLHANWINALFVTPEVMSGKVFFNSLLIAPVVVQYEQVAPALTLPAIAMMLYFTVMVVLFLRFLWKLQQFLFQDLNGINQAYSFFNRIFVSKKLSGYQTIYKHELTHVRQFHSVDIIIFELLAIILWFNPVVYGYKNSVKNIHEFIADEAACAQETKADYALLLLSNTLGVSPNYLVNSFFNQSLLKKRIIMLNKTKSPNAAWIKYGLSAPLFAAMLVFSSAKMETGAHAIVKQTTIAEPAGMLTQTPQVLSKPDTTISFEAKSSPDAIYSFTAKSLPDTIITFDKVEQLPKFPDGGDAAFGKYLASNIKYPAIAKENKIEGRVIVSFIVELDGALSDIKVLRDIGGSCGEEAIRVLKASPKWIPGMQNGKAVRVAYTCPITFNIADKQNLTIGGIIPTSALYLLNDKEISAKDFQRLDQKTIQSIEVLKDSTASALYGEKGKNGVIKIITANLPEVILTPPATAKPNGR